MCHAIECCWKCETWLEPRAVCDPGDGGSEVTVSLIVVLKYFPLEATSLRRYLKQTLREFKTDELRRFGLEVFFDSRLLRRV